MTFFLLPIIVGIDCNNIGDSFTIVNEHFDPHDNSMVYKKQIISIFNLDPGDTIDFSGISTTSITNLIQSDTVLETKTDSVYARISSLSDTILVKNDSILGTAKIIKDDTSNWFVLKYYTNDPDSFVFGSILRDYLDAADYNAIATVLGNDEGLSATQKDMIISACNQIITTLDFYKRYREQIWESNPSADAVEMLEKLVDNSIFLDTAGTVRPGLTLKEKTILQWFNLTIFRRHVDRGVIISPPPVPPQTFLYHSLSAYKIYGMLFQQGTTLESPDQNTIRRYIGISDLELIQVAYDDAFGFTYLDDKKIADRALRIGKDYQVTPLLSHQIPFLSEVNIFSLLLSGRAVVLRNKNLSTDTNAVFDLKLYYPLNGSIIENGSIVRITGTIAVVFIFKRGLLINAYIIHWNTEIKIQKTYDDGRITLYQERTDLKSPSEF